MNIRYLQYALCSLFIICLDRCTKWYALNNWIQEYVINSYVYFQVNLNRGISWGFFNYHSTASFALVTFIIVVVTLALSLYAYKKAAAHQSIIGELLIISGSLSNISDRIYYHGVIDFIVLHKEGLAWPVFNIADIAIVCGVCIMFIEFLYAESARTA